MRHKYKDPAYTFFKWFACVCLMYLFYQAVIR